MRARRMQSFGGGFGANPYAESEDVNPSSYLANLSDVMLVLACGLMIALVVAWSVKLPSSTEVVEGDKVEVSDVEDITGQEDVGGSGYNQLGMVYQDPNTGKMYLIQDTGEGEGSSDGSASSATSASSASSASSAVASNGAASQTGTSSVPQGGSSE